MRLATVRLPDGTTRAARVEGDTAVEVAAPDVGALLADPDWAGLATTAMGPAHGLDDVGLAPVVPRPPKIVCLGLNYASHIEEMGHELPAYPTLFAKYAVALTGPSDRIVLPKVSSAVDWEAELAFVVGRRCRHVPEDQAAAAIAGFTVLNDVSMRDWQMRTGQFLQGKTFEACTPVGPVLVTPDEVDGAPDLRIGCEVDGQVMQDSRTSDLLFGPAATVSYLSQIMTLEPGDLVATGTPGGVGAGRRPPVFLRPGQTVRTFVEGIGELVNEFVADI